MLFLSSLHSPGQVHVLGCCPLCHLLLFYVLLELASIMTQSSHYCHHTCWLMYGIDLHLLPRAYEACVDVMFAGHYHKCCRSPKMLVTFAGVQTTLSLYLRVVSLLFPFADILLELRS